MRRRCDRERPSAQQHPPAEARTPFHGTERCPPLNGHRSGQLDTKERQQLALRFVGTPVCQWRPRAPDIASRPRFEERWRQWYVHPRLQMEREKALVEQPSPDSPRL